MPGMRHWKAERDALLSMMMADYDFMQMKDFQLHTLHILWYTLSVKQCVLECIMTTASYNIRLDVDLKQEMDEITNSIGMTTAAAFNVFARQFVAHRGFPFEVVEPVPTERQFSQEMDRIYESMKAGAATEHELVEP